MVAGERSPGQRFLVAGAAILCALLFACSHPRESALPPASSVLAIGDSITAGYGIDAKDAWPAQLAERTGWNIVAAGVSGDQTRGGRERLPQLLALHSPALVIIELGGNDMLRRVSEPDIVANLEAMIDMSRAAGAKVVLMAVPEPSAFGALAGLKSAPFYQALATRAKVRLIEKALPVVLSDKALKLDMLHPNVQGHRVLAERAYDELSAIGFVAKR